MSSYFHEEFFRIPFTIKAKRFADRFYRKMKMLLIPEGTKHISLKTDIKETEVLFKLKMEKNKQKYSCSPNCPEWNQLDCENIKNNIKYSCKDIDGNKHKDTVILKHKVYVRGYNDLLEYIIGIKEDSVNIRFNRKIWCVILCNWNWLNHQIGKVHLVNNNTDIDILYFKFKLVSNKQRRQYNTIY